MDVTLLYLDGCPSWRTTDGHLRTLAAELGVTVSYREVVDAADAAALGFRGSPTVLVDGHDPFAADHGPASSDDPSYGLACRIYPTPDGPAGSPTFEQLREALTGEDGRSTGLRRDEEVDDAAGRGGPR